MNILSRWTTRLKEPNGRRFKQADARELIPNSARLAKLEKLLVDRPAFHVDQGSLTHTWSVQGDTLRYIYSQLAPGQLTLETGCGQTTVVFAIVGTKHTCVMPDESEAQRVITYCESLGLNHTINFIIRSSDVALSKNKSVPLELDFVLIDGAHAFPAPIIDWHYTARRMKVGGILAVDDYKMPSVKILYDFLSGEDEEWQFTRIVQNTAFFKKIRDPRQLVDWKGQKINADYPGF
jgi:hypothetical protein